MTALGFVKKSLFAGSAGVPITLSPRWRGALAALGFTLAALMALFWGTAVEIVDTWYRSATFNHGFLIVPIAGYLLWRRREHLLAVTPTPNAFGVALMALGALAWLLGDVAQVLMVQEFALVGMIQAAFLAVLGWRAIFAILFPLFYLVFAVPFGDFLVPYFQDWTAIFVVYAVRLLGIPVFLDGIFITTPSGHFEVAEACSGVRFLIATIALGVLFANITYRSWVRRGAFLALTLALPIVGNWIRAFGIVIIAYMTDNEVAVGVDHIVYGWVWFSFITLILLWLGMIFRDRFDDPAPAAAAAQAPEHGHFARAALAAVALSAAFPAYGAYVGTASGTLAPDALSGFTVASPWRPLADANAHWQPRFMGADAERMLAFTDGRRRVYLYVAYYLSQGEGHEAVSSDNTLEDAYWLRAGSTFGRAHVDGVPTDVAIMRLLAGARGRMTWQWYWIDGRFTANPYRAKLYQVRTLLTGGAPAAALVVAADYGAQPEEANEAIRDFLAALGPIRPILERSAAR